jgi:hypothetical protein
MKTPDCLKNLPPCPQYQSLFDAPYELVQHAGCANFRILSRWRTYDDAYCALHEQFTPEEQLELGVDVMRFGSFEY